MNNKVDALSHSQSSDALSHSQSIDARSHSQSNDEPESYLLETYPIPVDERDVPHNILIWTDEGQRLVEKLESMLDLPDKKTYNPADPKYVEANILFSILTRFQNIEEQMAEISPDYDPGYNVEEKVEKTIRALEEHHKKFLIT